VCIVILQAYGFAQSACSNVASDALFRECNNKLQTSHYREYCLTDTCAFAAAPVWLLLFIGDLQKFGSGFFFKSGSCLNFGRFYGYGLISDSIVYFP